MNDLTKQPKMPKPKPDNVNANAERKQASKLFNTNLEKPKAAAAIAPNVKQPQVHQAKEPVEEPKDPEEQEWIKQFKSLGFNDDEIRDKYLPEARKSKAQELERQRVQRDKEDWEKQNAAKPRGADPSQMEKIRQEAIKEFGLANRFSDSFYMLPDGRMLSGAGKGRGGYGRSFDHRDIGSSYLNAGVDIQETDRGGNSHNMLDFMRGGNIRTIPESNSIDVMSKPTSEQMNAIYNLWRRGDIDNIQITNPNDKYGQQLDYLEDIKSEREIADFFNRNFK